MSARRWTMNVLLGTLVLALLPAVPAGAHPLTAADQIDIGNQVPSVVSSAQDVAGPICVNVRQVEGAVRKFRAIVHTQDSPAQQLEGSVSLGSTHCTQSVDTGAFWVELTALTGHPGSTLRVEITHGEATSDAFSPTGDMRAERTGHAAALLPDGRVLVVGGERPDPSGFLTQPSSAEIFDPRSGSWQPAGTLTTYRFRPDLVTLDDGRIAVFGGVEAPADRKNLVEVFDPASGRWSGLGSLAGTRGGRASLLGSGKVLITGGGAVSTDQASYYEVFDPDTENSRTGIAQTPYRTGHTSTRLEDGRVLLAGGNGNDARASIYGYATDTFAATERMAVHRSGHVATLLADGRVLVSGGRDIHGGAYLTSAEVFDPRTGTWSLIDGGIGGETHSVTQLVDGRVLGIASAYSRTWAVTLDPDTGTVSSLEAQPGMNRPGHTATLLQNGRVLIAGGGDRHYSTRSAEIFSPGRI